MTSEEQQKNEDRIRFEVSAYLNTKLQPYFSDCSLDRFFEDLPSILKLVFEFARVRGASRILIEDMRHNFLMSLQVNGEHSGKTAMRRGV